MDCEDTTCWMSELDHGDELSHSHLLEERRRPQKGRAQGWSSVCSFVHSINIYC